MPGLIESFYTYYGADWASMVLGFSGAWLVTGKNRWGFLLLICSMALAAVTAVIAGQYGFIAANCINIAIAARGYLKWTAEDRAAEQL